MKGQGQGQTTLNGYKEDNKTKLFKIDFFSLFSVHPVSL